ncbi:phage holin family protein [Epilithonimonas zeae]|uniref:Bacteriophage holin family protein n=1 Tax=Epilithonimonas zeae TaxID=1416779 RepID=A0A1N6GW43_9FLAO|nr:phage holin family protein [Epilithonimonas zeae]SIO11744.1 Bacteriophage holin family protein [Epilithonimonas zeae]
MKEFIIYKQHLVAILATIKKPSVLIPAVGVVSLSNFEKAFFLLLILMLADYVTGIMASWNQWEKSDKTTKFWNTGFTSEKTRLSIIKSVTYFLFIILTYGIEIIFKIKSFGSNQYTEHEVTLTLVAIAISCAIEFYSIFFENLPKAGFDIWNYLKKMTGKAKKTVTTVKEITNGNNDNSSST